MVWWGKTKGKQILNPTPGPTPESSCPTSPTKPTRELQTPTTPKTPDITRDTESQQGASTRPFRGNLASTGLPTPPESPESAIISRRRHIARQPQDSSDRITPVLVPSPNRDPIVPRTEDRLAPQSRAPAQAKSLRVKRLLPLLEELSEKKYRGEVRVRTTKLTPAQYRNLLDVVNGHATLNDYFHGGLR